MFSVAQLSPIRSIRVCSNCRGFNCTATRCQTQLLITTYWLPAVLLCALMNSFKMTRANERLWAYRVFCSVESSDESVAVEPEKTPSVVERPFTEPWLQVGQMLCFCPTWSTCVLLSMNSVNVSFSISYTHTHLPGYVFCMLHRLPEQHECPFDHLGRGRQEAILKMVKLDRKVGRSCQRIGEECSWAGVPPEKPLHSGSVSALNGIRFSSSFT